ncbi:MAG: sulfatase [Fimbriimonadaceae bacterium]|nr:sulfatase [Fimbriimonadaceae bacterium]
MPDRRRFCQQILAGVAAAPLRRAARAAVMPACNILLVAFDDLRPELACFGQTAVQTPHWDALAQRAVLFERAYCQYPVCNPSRTSLLTGRRPDQTGVLNNNTDFRQQHPDWLTLPQLFRQHGASTAAYGKIYHQPTYDATAWEVCEQPQATALGRRGTGRNLTAGKLAWCAWRAAEGGADDQPDGQIAARAIARLEQAGERPFFLAVGFNKPHDPFVAPAEYFDRYPLDQIAVHRDPADASPDTPQTIPAGARGIFAQFSDAERREFRRAYYAGLTFTDAQLGKVLAALTSHDLWRSTLVILLGDNGYHLGERGWWNKDTLYEHSARVPLVIRPPGPDRPGRCPAPVELLDLYPTIADYAALPPPAALQGVSLRPLLAQPTAAWDRPAYTQVQRGRLSGRSVRTARWRYTEWSEGSPARELYDHQSDPGEWHNVAEDPTWSGQIAQLREVLRAPAPK